MNVDNFILSMNNPLDLFIEKRYEETLKSSNRNTSRPVNNWWNQYIVPNLCIAAV